MTDGQAALERGDWQHAKQAFELSLQQGDDPEALEGLGLAAWWLDLADVVFDARERAYRGFLERDDRAAAARMAVWLAWDTAAFRGEQAVASGWLQRARRLLEGQPDAPENRSLWGTQELYRVFSLVNGGRARETDLFEGLR
jgi:LuxR family transcriptional regulator, maltose regulon positive regulatory protein